MKKRTLITTFLIVGLVTAVSAGPLSAQEGGRYYVGKILALDALKNKITIDEYNSGSSMEFTFGGETVPYDLLLGDEVMIFSDQDKNINDIRLISEETGRMRPRRRDLPAYERENRPERYSRMWDPMEEISSMQEAMNRMFRNSLRGRVVDRGLFNSNTSFDNDFKLEDTGDGYIVKVDMSGMDKSNVNIEVNKDSITVKSKSDVEQEKTTKDGSFSYHSFGAFLRTIPLPPDADTNGLETKQEGDTMVLRMPKKTA